MANELIHKKNKIVGAQNSMSITKPEPLQPAYFMFCICKVRIGHKTECTKIITEHFTTIYT